jgi:hypothetical protein
VFRNHLTKATEYMQTAHSLWQTFSSPTGGAAATTATTSTTAAAASTAGASLAALPPASSTQSLWARYAAPAAYAVGSALVAGAVGAAYARRDDLVGGAGWLGDHAKYVSHLWDQAELRARLARVCALSAELGVPFRTCVHASAPHRCPA